MHSPMEQFEIKRLLNFHLGSLDASYTNSALWMTIAVILAFLLFVLGTQKRALIPGRIQGMAEMGYEFVAGMVRDNVGDAGKKYFPFVLTLFIFILFCNVLGLIPYIMSHGADGLKQAAEDAVLSANYVMAALKDVMTPAFEGPCMHEALFDDGFLKDTGVSTLDFAKAMIDEGFHPMTMYFPLVVHGAMLVEPTETESKASLDQFIMAVRSIAERAKAGDQSLKAAPVHAPRRRLDETLAARKPVLVYREPEPAQAAE